MEKQLFKAFSLSLFFLEKKSFGKRKIIAWEKGTLGKRKRFVKGMYWSVDVG